VVVRQFNEFEFREHFFQLQTDKFVEAVIVINVQKASADKVFAKIGGLLFGEHHVHVAGHVYVGIQEQVTAGHLDDILFRSEIHTQFPVAERDQIGKRRLVCVPVPSAVVL